jgi:hypothetical protein
VRGAEQAARNRDCWDADGKMRRPVFPEELKALSPKPTKAAANQIVNGAR